jgi:N-acetylglutamate synthase-like GNAT family acetyltransferase
MNVAYVYMVKTRADATELDALLWRVLWEPLGLPRDVRHVFRIDGRELELAAREEGRIVGGLVAVWTNETEVELRHLAVSPDARGKGIGRSLVTDLFRIAGAKKCHRIHTIARNTSVGFFRDIGFRTAPGEAPRHPSFLKHGITFHLMEMDVPYNPKT